MSDIFSIIKLLIFCGSVLFIAFMVLMAMPNSKLRGVVLPIVGWLMALFCAVYFAVPFDVIPEIILGPLGYIDDFGAICAGVVSAGAAINARQEAKELLEREQAESSRVIEVD